MTTTETKLWARGDRYRNRALKLLRNARRWRDQVREASDYLTAGWERAVKDADAADERADRAEAELRTARARVAALEAGAAELRRTMTRVHKLQLLWQFYGKQATSDPAFAAFSRQLLTALQQTAAPTAAADTGAEAAP